MICTDTDNYVNVYVKCPKAFGAVHSFMVNVLI